MNHTIERKEQRLRAVIRARGLRAEPYGTAGAMRVAGRGVYIIVAAMRYLEERDFDPPQHREQPDARHSSGF